MKKTILTACFFACLAAQILAQIPTTSDCPTSNIIVPSGNYLLTFEGNAGGDPAEMNPGACFSGAIPSANVESNSRWLRWVCPKDDTITFVISPLTPTDDLDFMVFKLDEGIGNCDKKTVIRCEAAGGTSFPSPCMGKTGLKLGETDVEEPAGCGPANNNFLAPLIVKTGEAYALAINDFTAQLASCTVDFGSISGPVGAPGDGLLSAPMVSPNPSTGFFNVFFEKNAAGQTCFSLFDLRGNLIFQEKKWAGAGRQTEVFGLENLPAATYFFKITDGQKTGTVRIVKN